MSTRAGWTGMALRVVLLVLVLALASPSVDGRRRQKRGDRKCSEEMMVQYLLTFHGYWAKSTFPKMYPRYRPKAQWSKLVGRSHGPEYELWSLGKPASPAVQQFAEEGSTLLLDAEAQGYNDTFDLFTAAPILGGVGRTSTRVLLDGAHPRVSLMVKLVPSPDWFVGVSGFELCRRGRWKRRLAVNLRPLDAGTDKGLTYTSPNWPAVPPEDIFEIRPDYPEHPASSFYDPKTKNLPRIARVVFERVVQYSKRGAKPVPREELPNVVVERQTHEIEEDQLTLLSPGLPSPLPELHAVPNPPLELRPERMGVLLKDQSPTPMAEQVMSHLEIAPTHKGPSSSPLVSRDPRTSALVRVSSPTRASATAERQTPPKPTLGLSITSISSRPRLTADFSEDEAYVPGQATETGAAPLRESPRLILTAESSEVPEADPSRPRLTVGFSKYSHWDTSLPAQHPTLASAEERTTLFGLDEGYKHPTRPIPKDQRPLHELNMDSREGGVRLVKLQTSRPHDDTSEDQSHLHRQRQDVSWRHSPTASSALRSAPVAAVEVETRHPSVSYAVETRSWSSHTIPTQRVTSKLEGVLPTSSVQRYMVEPEEGPGSQHHDSVEVDVTPRRELPEADAHRYASVSAHLYSTKQSAPQVAPTIVSTVSRAEEGRESHSHVFNGEVEPEWDTSRFDPDSEADDREARESAQHARHTAPSPRLSGPRHRSPHRPREEPTEPPYSSRGGRWQGLVGGLTYDAAARPAPEGQGQGLGEPGKEDVLRDSVEVSALEQTRYHQRDDGSPQDCIVTKWGEWSPCSKTCGFGVRQRERYVLQHPKNGGQPCPRLRSETVCGSMRNCRWDYFSRFFNKKQRHRRRLRHEE